MYKVYDSSLLLTTWQSMLDFVQWHPPQERECVNPLQIIGGFGDIKVVEVGR